jgi:hypothetical protein
MVAMVNWQITTSLLFMIFMSTLGLISWALTSANHAADALNELAEYKVSSAAQIHDLRTATDKQIEALRADGTLSIGFGIHLDNLEKAIEHAETREGEAERRLNDLEKAQALLTVELGAITQASVVRIGPRK